MSAWEAAALGRIASFCRAHFSVRGAWRLNRAALGLDLLRAPINVFFAPTWLLIQLIGWLLRLCGARRAGEWLARTPSGLTTRVQRKLADHVAQDVLAPLPGSTSDPAQGRIVRLGVLRYMAARNATAEITANLTVLISGLWLFDTFTPGGLGLGKAAARAFHHEQSVRGFWGGDALGRVWYGWFPPDTPVALQLGAITAALALIAVVAALSGLVADPLQRLFGLQQRRLRKLVGALARDFRTARADGFAPREPLVARVFDGMDWLRLGG